MNFFVENVKLKVINFQDVSIVRRKFLAGFHKMDFYMLKEFFWGEKNFRL